VTNFDKDPRYQKIQDNEYLDTQTGDMIIELDNDTGELLGKLLGRDPDEDGTFTLSSEEFKMMFIDPYEDLFSDESDLNDL